MKVGISPVRLWCLFAVVILLTRSMQFAFPAAPPDATLALMFLGGMWIRRWPGFVGLMAAAFAADWIATGSLGVPDFCFSPAYAGLVLVYLAVWGWWMVCSGDGCRHRPTAPPACFVRGGETPGLAGGGARRGLRRVHLPTPSGTRSRRASG
jgi:hypothetical protein